MQKNILYKSEYEHDSCGIGFAADIKGRKSHEIVERALTVLERMTHRGAESADNKTGDGSGILLQIPHKFYKKLVPALPEAGKYGTGLMFLPKNAAEQDKILKKFESLCGECGLSLLAVNDVPVDSAVPGTIALTREPAVKQAFVGESGVGERETGSENLLPTKLYILRKKFERYAAEMEGDVYMPSLSERTIIYKGMLMPAQLRTYFPHLQEHDLESAVALVHSRFSTNTFPSWDLAQPFRMIAHNGEINTIKGNRFWAAAREASYRSTKFGDAIKEVLPVIEAGCKSDSSSFDNMLEFLVMAGRSLPQALMMLIPEAWNEKNPIPDELKAFYEYNACLMEPWDGPASMVFCDGRYVGGTLDRNGLRPSRYTITKNSLIVMASETGVQDFAPEEIEYKGRLMPGKLLLVDLEEGRIIPDVEVKRTVSTAKPYLEWVREGVITLEQGGDRSRESGAGSREPGFQGEVSVLKTDSGVHLPYPLSPRQILFIERQAGYTREDRDKLLLPMIENSQEPTASMGTDTPLAALSGVPQRVYSYFKQLFAQVTNPPIDSIREDLVMTLTSFAGPQLNLLEETAQHCKRIKVKNPILTAEDMAELLRLAEGRFKVAALDAVFPVESGVESRESKVGSRESGVGSRGSAAAVCSLHSALLKLCGEAEEAAAGGAALLVLSDRKAVSPSAGVCAIPALLALGAVHHHLIKKGLRTKTSLIVESFEPREIMHFALLFGYGADLVTPYGALAVIKELTKSFDAQRAGTYQNAEHNYLKGLQKALLKVMSKMGTSTLRSYRGSQIFEAVGLGSEVIDLCFTGTVSPVGGIGFAELEVEALARYKAACEKDAPPLPPPASRGGSACQPDPYPRQAKGDSVLDLRPSTLNFGAGQYQWRKTGEIHAWNPETIYLLQWATRSGDYKKFKEFSTLTNELNRKPHVLRGLLDFAWESGIGNRESSPATRNSIPISEVEPASEIMKRFTTGAMSFGSISKEAHETIAAALNSIRGRSNSGEGGEDPERFHPRADGSFVRSAIKQVASARFGVTSEYLANCIELQIKIAQGAKPGEGGQLPGHKVDIMIGKVRHSTPGVTLISPPPHHDIYSIEDLAELIFDLKNANPEARISVKLVSEAGVGTIAAGVVKAHADNLLISGYDGGTGASPQSSIRHAGLPWELGLAETHQTLAANGLRSRVRLQTDGQLKTGRDIVIAGMLGAEEFGFGTSALVVLGCVMMRKCHENTCPMGVATQDPVLRARFSGKSEYLINFFRFLAEEVREIMAEAGFSRFNDLVGRSDLLVQRNLSITTNHTNGANNANHNIALRKASKLDLSAILQKVEGNRFVEGGTVTYCTQSQVHKIENVLDRTLIERCGEAILNKKPVTLEMTVHNTDRAVGAMLSYEVSKRWGGAGLGSDCININWRGSAGQSFGAFLAPGINFKLSGDANDYLGKGLSGGVIAVLPPQGSSFKSNKNIIAGNTILYGATSGEAYISGVVGERFCVRNSGATAVVEGTGDHCAEYMTGGKLVVLGDIGRNFAAGMSGGIAYILDRRGNFEYYLNKGMVELSGLEESEDENFVLNAIRKHIFWTQSAYAQSILNNWAEEKPRFIKILPVEYKRALEQQKLAELDVKLSRIRETQEIGDKR